MKADITEMLRVGTLGTAGMWATIKLVDVATLVSIAVGLLTFAYIATKLFYLIKHNGNTKGLD